MSTPLLRDGVFETPLPPTSPLATPILRSPVLFSIGPTPRAQLRDMHAHPPRVQRFCCNARFAPVFSAGMGAGSVDGSFGMGERGWCRYLWSIVSRDGVARCDGHVCEGSTSPPREIDLEIMCTFSQKSCIISMLTAIPFSVILTIVSFIHLSYSTTIE